MTNQLPKHLRIGTLATILLGSCTDGPAAPAAGKGSDGSGSAGAPALGPSERSDSACTTNDVAVAPLRRLTAFEYRNTLADLLRLEKPPTLVLPADEVTTGFDNNAAILRVTAAHAEAYQEAAEAGVAAALPHLDRLLPCGAEPKKAADQDACAEAFIDQFGRRAFRRPLDAGERERVLGLYQVGKGMQGFRKGIELVMRGLLQSPAFLYRLEIDTLPNGNTALSQYEIATRLSYFLWATMPDDQLLDDAQNARLGTRKAIEATATRMLKDAKAMAVVADFHEQWLDLGLLRHATKDQATYPQWNAELRDALGAQAHSFIEAVWQGDHKLNTLLTSTKVYANEALRGTFAVPENQKLGAAFESITLPDQPRAGLLTLPAFLAAHALPDQSSPIHRGIFVRERLLCQPPPPLPAGLNVMAPEPDPNASTRERFEQHRADPACAGCHRLFDSIGMGFENYDGIGRFRTHEAGKPIDATGEIVDSDDIDGTFDGVAALGKQLARSSQVQECVATQWYRYALGRWETESDSCGLSELSEVLKTSNGDLHALLIALTQTDAFLRRR